MTKNVKMATAFHARKDNRNMYGERFIGGGTPRQPKKCRKTAWKRFNRLFPERKIETEKMISQEEIEKENDAREKYMRRKLIEGSEEYIKSVPPTDVIEYLNTAGYFEDEECTRFSNMLFSNDKDLHALAKQLIIHKAKGFRKWMKNKKKKKSHSPRPML